MDFASKNELLRQTNELLKSRLPVELGVNKSAQLERLIFELACERGILPEKLFDELGLDEVISRGRGGLFHRLKETLLDRRYPARQKSSVTRLMPIKVASSDQQDGLWRGELDPERIFLERSVSGSDWSDRFVNHFPSAEVILVDGFSEAMRQVGLTRRIDRYRRRRNNVFLIRQRSSFVKLCPCSDGCVRCGYWILNLGFGCPLDCSYCYLQTYSNFPALVLPANIGDAFDALKALDRKASGPLRLGNGEFADSFALEKYTGYAAELVKLFGQMHNLVLELKTKVTNLGSVLSLPAPRNVVLSWSLNTPVMAKFYERGAPSPQARIEAAERAAKAGFKIGFHFDPIIFYHDWREHYLDLIDKLFSSDVLKKKVEWISLGTLRYTAGLKQMAEKRFENMNVFYEGEFFEGADGKLRYPMELRVEMYNALYRRIKHHSPDVWVYLCMEVPRAWELSELDNSLCDYQSWLKRKHGP